MLDFLKRGYNNVREVVGERDKLIDIKEVVKLAGEDGVVTYDEIRESLRKYVFILREINFGESKNSQQCGNKTRSRSKISAKSTL